MIISTDNSVMRYAYGDKESIRMCKEAGFDGIDYSLFKMHPDNDILNLPDEERKALAYDLRNSRKRSASASRRLTRISRPAMARSEIRFITTTFFAALSSHPGWAFPRSSYIP